MKKDIESSISDLENITSNTEKALDKLIQASEKADASSSSTLFGAAGGIIGALAGTLIALHIALSVLLLSTPLTALGIIGGILVYRGRNGIKLEKMIAQNRIACNEVLDRINSLPDNAPQDVVDGLWENYNMLNGAYRNQSAIALSPKEKSKQGLMLPGSSKKTLNNSMQPTANAPAD